MKKSIEYLESLLEKESNGMDFSIKKAEEHAENMEHILNILFSLEEKQKKGYMTIREKASILLEEVDKVHTADIHTKRKILNILMEGLRRIEEEETKT